MKLSGKSEAPSVSRGRNPSEAAFRGAKGDKVSVVITVFNEQDSLQLLLDALSRQTLKPFEIIIVDGGSTDDTWAILQKNKTIRSYKKPGNRSVGRNFGVSRSISPIIAFTDAGCIPDPTWLAEIVKPFSSQSTQVVSGYYRGLPQNTFQACLVLYVLVPPDKAVKTEFFPSTRSMALRKSVWLKHKFDESLWHNEDYAYAHTLKKSGFNFIFAPKAMVSWIPRKNLKQAAWMFTRFAIGDIQAGILRPQVKILAIRYLAFIYLFFLTPYVLVLVPVYLVWSILKNYKYVRDPRAIFWLPVLQITADLSVLFGSLVGLISKTV